MPSLLETSPVKGQVVEHRIQSRKIVVPLAAGRPALSNRPRHR